MKDVAPKNKFTKDEMIAATLRVVRAMAERGKCTSSLHPFEKLYHKEHIPFHYELVTGYDDTEKLLYFIDCGREDTQVIPYDDLRLATDCSYPGLSKPNTVWMIRTHTSKGKYEIAKEAFARKKDLFLHPPVGLISCRGKNSK